MPNHSNNSKPDAAHSDADSRPNATNDHPERRPARKKIRKKIPIKNPNTRIRQRTEKYQALRRSQNRLGWSIAIGTFAGIGIGLAFGYIAIGTAGGLIVGLAFGLVIAG